ncbi:uncharacterized protein LOC143913330 [Arctopsyche grandis]|uniref:uncharacterized protein LOC143913330 n=1 Tax=Arctopsyche grandis TaxID=121162 RepID=UPI00406D8BA8
MSVEAQTRVQAEARERLLEGLSVSSSWAGRRALCPPAAADRLLPAAKEVAVAVAVAVAVYASGARGGRLVSGVWAEGAAPELDSLASTHVYCVANAVDALQRSLSAHRIIDDDDDSPHPALIKCSAIRARTPQQLALLRGGSYPNIRQTADKPALANGTSKTESKQIVDDIKKVENAPVKNASSTVTTNATAKSKSNIIAGLFARQKTHPKPKNSPPSTSSVKIEPKIEPETIKVLNDEVKEQSKPNVSTQSKKKAKTTNKKRKRIATIESDDSDDSRPDDIFEKEPEELPPVMDFNEEDEIPPTPEAPKRKHSPEKHSQKRKRDKTYMGEDGYFHTIKNVMCSDDENVDDQKENSQNVNKCDEIPNTPESDNKLNLKNENKTVDVIKTKSKSKSKLETKKSSPPGKGKQSNITNFFKKK